MKDKKNLFLTTVFILLCILDSLENLARSYGRNKATIPFQIENFYKFLAVALQKFLKNLLI